MSRLRNRLAALERQRAPGDLVYAVSFSVAGMSRDEIVAEEAKRRRSQGDFRPFALAPHFAVVPEVAETNEAWLAAVAAVAAAGLK